MIHFAKTNREQFVSFQDLRLYVISQLTLRAMKVPSDWAIKAEFGRLITEEYFERNEDDKNLTRYLVF